MSDISVHLRPFQEPDLDLLNRSATDPAFSAPFEWSGFSSPARLRRRWEKDGFLEGDPHYLAVVQDDQTALGFVIWRDPKLFGRPGCAWEIGILLAPEHRGKGVGTAAQGQLVEYLFETTPLHRLCAFTEVDNLAEQKALERCGFRCEGMLRQAGFRGGRWRDALVYGLLRGEP